jgi:hypothetical protein
MKTDELIAALAADTQAKSRPIGSTVWTAAASGAVVAALIFYFDIGLRPDLPAAIETPRFLFKYVLTLTLLAAAMGLVLHLARPGAVPTPWLMALAVPPGLLILATITELAIVPASDWSQRLVGSNAFVCLVLIPSLSALPLIALILALRQGAPTHPVLAGAAAGLAAAGIGATLYATHCQDDSPLFLSMWYTMAIMIVALAGAILGARLLRW